jgi:hypothetical protein
MAMQREVFETVRRRNSLEWAQQAKVLAQSGQN